MKKTLNPKKQKECTDTTHDIQIDYCGYCVTCAKKPKAEEKKLCQRHFDDRVHRNLIGRYEIVDEKYCEFCQPKAETGWEERFYNLFCVYMRDYAFEGTEGGRYNVKPLTAFIAKELERERAKIIREIQAMQYAHDDIERCQEMRHVERMVNTNKVLDDVLQAIKEEQPEGK